VTSSRSMFRPDEAGESLVEVLVAVTIMGFAVVAIVSGIGTTILMTDVHRKQATAGVLVRNYAEAVEKYVASGSYDSSASPNYLPATVGFSSPSANFTPSVQSVQCWDDTNKAFVTCAAGSKVQRVLVKVNSSDQRASEALAVIVRQP
jgi:Tfp pilus assembly protein PilV